MKILLILLFIAVASGIHLRCWFTDITVTETDGTYNLTLWEGYSCYVSAMDFSGNSTYITGYNGTLRTNYTNADVKGIFVNADFCPQCNLTFVPKGFSAFFPNITVIHYWKCPINTLNGNEVDEYSNLIMWAIQYGSLERVPGNLFALTPNLKFVSFNRNLIYRVGEGLFDNLTMLEKIWFHSNICISMVALDPTEVPFLIEALRDDCQDVETTTTTTTTKGPPVCEIDNLEDFVCGLDEEIDGLKIKDINLQEDIDGLKNENQNLKENNEELRGIIEELQAIANEKAAKLEEEIARLNEIESFVDELVKRPCAC